jgi:dTDP-4-amino-4,6-dideoxygalactose transaminase
LPFYRPAFGREEERAIVRVLRSRWITTGPVVRAFEETLRSALGAKYTVAVSSCSAGLLLSLDALGIGPGDEVITTPLTFAATANAILHRGAVPRFADVDKRTMTLDPAQVSKQINRKTRAILPVHFAGQPCDLSALQSLARKHHLVLIEDAAHALGAEYKSRPIGHNAQAAVFSFNAVKNLTTGEGGLVATRHADLAKRLRVLMSNGLDRDAWGRFCGQGQQWSYHIQALGYKANLTDLQAALGLAQYQRFAVMQGRRAGIVQRYQEAFRDQPALVLPAEAPGTRHAWHIYVLRLKPERLRINRDTFLQALAAEGILCNVHYHPIHRHPYYQKRLAYHAESLPVAEAVGETAVTLPLYPALRERDVQDVIRAVRKLVDYYAR